MYLEQKLVLKLLTMLNKTLLPKLYFKSDVTEKIWRAVGHKFHMV